jgi:hypothetical protein
MFFYESVKDYQEWFFCSFRNEAMESVKTYLEQSNRDQFEFMYNTNYFEYMLYCNLDMGNLSLHSYREKDFDQVLNFFQSLKGQIDPASG